MRNLIIYEIFVALFIIGMQSEGYAQAVAWDTVGTGTVRLAVSNHGSMGLNGIGGANMDFSSSGLDCDPNATVYLYSGGPFIIHKIDSAAGVFSWSTGMYQNDASAAFSFAPDPSGPPSSHFVGADGSDAFFTGRFLNWDSTIGMERTYYAPTTGAPNDNFIIVRTDIYPLDGFDHPDLAIGEVIDWKIPSDSDAANLGGIRGKMVYLQGSDTGVVAGCQPNGNRFGSSTFLGMHTSTELQADNCASDGDQRGIYAIDNSSESAAPNGILDSSFVWNATGSLTGQWVLVDTAADQRIYSTFVYNYTLLAADTLTIYNAILSQENGTVADFVQVSRDALIWFGVNLRPGCGGLGPCIATGNVDGDPSGIFDLADITFMIDILFINHPSLPEPWVADVNGDCSVDSLDLNAMLDRLNICFWFPEIPCEFNTPTCCDPVFNPCCVGNTGNIDNSMGGTIDISDLTKLIDHQFISFAPLFCPEQGNVDGDSLGTVDIADLTHLIDHLFINFPPTAPCQ